MKKRKIGFLREEDNQEHINPTIHIIESYLSENYSPWGGVEQKEFRTTMELINEMQEMVSIGMNDLNALLIKLGYKTIFIDGVSNWVMYDKNV